MRWIIIGAVVLILSIVGWFWYPRLVSDTQLDPYSILPSTTWTIIELNDSADFRILSDSNSALTHFAPFETCVQIGSMIDRDVSGLLFVYGDPIRPAYGLLSEHIIKDEALLALLPVHTSFGRIELYLSESSSVNLDASGIGKMLDTSGEGPLKVLLQPAKLLTYFSANIGPKLSHALMAQFAENAWVAIDLADRGKILRISGIENSENNNDQHTIPSNSTNLLRYMPGNSGAAILNANDSQIVGLAYCPYSLSDTTGEANLFAFIEYATDREKEEAVSQSYQDLPIKITELPASFDPFNIAWKSTAYSSRLSEHVEVYAATFEQLAKLIDDYLADDHLRFSPYYTNLEAYVSEASFTLFLRPDLLRNGNPILDKDLNPMRVNALIYQRFNELPLQRFHSLTVMHNKEIKDEAPVRWSVQLDTTLIGGPWSFTNHYSGEQEVVVQDAKNQLYLINKDGKTLWKKRLQGSVLGDIKMIDAFSNGKNQMVFCTPEYLHFIDRNGNQVSGFPKKLDKSASSAPLCVQYTGKSDYRFIVGDGGVLRNFDTEGQPVNGWKNPDMTHPLAQAPSYLYFSGKDYLLARTKKHELFIFDRTGAKRKSSITLDSTIRVLSLKPGKSFGNTRYIGFNNLGDIYTHPMEGKAQKSNILPLGDDVGFLSTGLAAYQYISVKQDRVVILDEKQDVSLDFLMPDFIKPKIQLLSNERAWIGLMSTNGQEFYILDMHGRLLDKMPLDGSGKALLIDYENQGSMNLVIGDGASTLKSYKLAD